MIPSRYRGIEKTQKEINKVLEQISDAVNTLKKVSDGNKVYVGINDVLDIIDKYKVESKEESDG